MLEVGRVTIEPRLSEWTIRELIAHLEGDLRDAQGHLGKAVADPDKYWRWKRRIDELERHLAELRWL